MVSTSAPPAQRDREPAQVSRPWAFLALIVLFLFAFLLAKAEFHSPGSNAFFYAYGIAVTSVVLFQMIVAFFVYRDPYVVASRSPTRRLVPAVSGADFAADWHGAPESHTTAVVESSRPMVTCLVAVFNDETIIGQCLRSVCAQTYPNLEVIVVNDASTDGTQRALDDLARELPIRVIELKQNVGKKAALVRGASLAQGQIFAFTDSDSTWDPSALDHIVTALEADPALGAVSGHCRALNPDATFLTRIQDTWYQGQFGVRKAFESAFGAVTCVSGPLAVFRREAIYNLLPAWERDSFLGDAFRFATDRTLTGYLLGSKQVSAKLIEATDPDSIFLAKRYRIRNWNVEYCKSALAWTHVPETLPMMLRQQIRWKKSFLRNVFLTGRFYWRRPIPPAAIYYLHILFVLAGPFVAFRHMVYLPLHGNMLSMIAYLFGITVIGSAFAFAHKAEEPTSTDWMYRPLMSLLSTLVLSWLIFYSVATIKKMTWSRA
jgi:cellulose synthase/poly-beta-1,6-N-acetylglucosamine synthase-like glycosyltransferase